MSARRGRRMVTVCSEPGCPTLTTKGRCLAHRPTGRPAAWFRLTRQAVRALLRCAVCGAPADEMDHVVPVSEGGSMLDPDNIQPLCRRCHAKKTRQEA